MVVFLLKKSRLVLISPRITIVYSKVMINDLVTAAQRLFCCCGSRGEIGRAKPQLSTCPIVLLIKRHSISATADYIFDFCYSTVLYSLQRDRGIRLEHLKILYMYMNAFSLDMRRLIFQRIILSLFFTEPLNF
jgi:hypothetical protein